MQATGALAACANALPNRFARGLPGIGERVIATNNRYRNAIFTASGNLDHGQWSF
jgi:hypothetical protein